MKQPKDKKKLGPFNAKFYQVDGSLPKNLKESSREVWFYKNGRYYLEFRLNIHDQTGYRGHLKFEVSRALLRRIL